MIPGVIPDTFNPRVFYVSREYYDSSNSLSSHFHPFCVIMYTYEMTGAGWYRIEGKRHPIEKGTLVVCNPAVYHEKILSPDSSIREFHVAFDPVHIGDQAAGCILGRTSYMLIKTGDLGRRIEQTFFEALEEKERAEPGFDIVIKAIAIKLIALTLRLIHQNPVLFHTGGSDEGIEPIPCHDRGFPLKANKRGTVESVRRFFNENYSRKIDIGSIAKSLHISHVYLSRIFRQETGETAISYLTKLRLNMARELLESGEYSVKSAASIVGYQDPAYFSRHFKKYFGIPPTECRKQG